MRRRRLPLLALAGLLFTAAYATALRADDRPALIEHVAALGGRGATFSLPLDRYRGDWKPLPIGVFDSGIGGLTVLEAILALDEHNNGSGAPGADGRPDFEHERFIYLGDQANLPYGNYASAGRTDFLRELIVRDGLFLLGDRYWPALDAPAPRHDKPPVKAIVIACNTATAFGLDDLRAATERWGVPVLVVGVVEAGARGVLDAVHSDPTVRAAAVLATVGTCSSGAYPRTVARLAGQQGLRVPAVHQHGCVGLAAAIEGQPAYVAAAADGPTAAGVEYLGPAVAHPTAPLRPELAEAYGFDPAGVAGRAEGPEPWRLTSAANYVRYDVTALVDEYALKGGQAPIGVVVLGCTHFPLVAADIARQFARLREFRLPDGRQPYRDLIAADLALVDPGRYAARELFRGLFLRRLLADAPADDAPRDRFYVTAPSPELTAECLDGAGGLAARYKFGRAAGQFDREDVRVVPLDADARALAAVAPWRLRLPHVARRLPTDRRVDGP